MSYKINKHMQCVSWYKGKWVETGKWAEKSRVKMERYKGDLEKVFLDEFF